MPLTIEERSAKKDEFLIELKNLYHVLTFDRTETEKIDKQFAKVIAVLSHFEMEMLPYSAASKFIYEINDDDVEYFFAFFEQMLSDRLKDAPTEEVLLKAIKLIEHLDLASSQKAYLFQQQEQQLKELTKKMVEVNTSLIQYNESKFQIEKKLEDFASVAEHMDSFSEKLHKFENDFKVVEEKFERFESDFGVVEDKFERIEKSTEQITVNLISILGIFASILLGAYGSIQGFSNIFSNANNIGIGKILMLSSVGASAILLILFFLLSSIARLTDRKFGNGGSSFINKHPIMFFSHCILTVVFTTGGVIELIKGEVTIEKYWLWILLLAVLIIQVLFIYQTKSLWGIFKYYIQTKEPFKKSVRFVIFIVMATIIAAYYFGYF